MMTIAITGGTGFVGRHLARSLLSAGHEVVLIARGCDRRDPAILGLEGTRFHAMDLGAEGQLADVFSGCDAVAHCAGINRQIGRQTYERVHVRGTRNVVAAARRAGVKRLLFISFLRARPRCGSGYLESKWRAEEIVRSSGLETCVVKAGIMYGQGDHMLDHLSLIASRLHFLPLVGLEGRSIRPTAIGDVVRVLEAFLVEGRLANRTVAVMGPEEMRLAEAARRVARTLRRGLLVFPMPVLLHYPMAWILGKIMPIPLVSMAQVRILSEGIVEPCGDWEPLPADLQPMTRFTSGPVLDGVPARWRPRPVTAGGGKGS